MPNLNLMLHPLEPDVEEEEGGSGANTKISRPWLLKPGGAPAKAKMASIRTSTPPAFMRDPGSLLAMAVMAFVFYMQIVRHGLPPSLPNAFTAALIGGAIFLFAVRREPTHKGTAVGAILAIV